MAIWNLIENGAIELTEQGLSPFTRVDLIKYVQRKNPAYGPDSINPIIQGLTDNLHGGAPGAVGKNILHSVGRGLFVLRTKNSEDIQQVTNPQTDKPITRPLPQKNNPLSVENTIYQFSNSKVQNICGYDFRFMCNIEPEREPSGEVHVFMPQSRFGNKSSVGLNRYGKGPFCKFKIPRDLQYPGVYALMEGTNIKYIGECDALSSRYNMGYGNISPRNCFLGGQETNCRINNLIYQEISAGSEISLWFYYTLDYKAIESQLRADLLPSWNRI